MRLIAIDPGKNTGVAIFQNTILLECGVLQVGDFRQATQALMQMAIDIQPDKAVIEVPRVYLQKNWKGDPNDLIWVALIAGIGIAAFAGFCKADLISPHEWKGNRPKEVDNEYTRSKLKPVELEIIERCRAPKSVMHNVLDAIGLGLWILRRR